MPLYFKPSLTKTKGFSNNKKYWGNKNEQCLGLPNQPLTLTVVGAYGPGEGKGWYMQSKMETIFLFSPFAKKCKTTSAIIHTFFGDVVQSDRLYGPNMRLKLVSPQSPGFPYRDVTEMTHKMATIGVDKLPPGYLPHKEQRWITSYNYFMIKRQYSPKV